MASGELLGDTRARAAHALSEAEALIEDLTRIELDAGVEELEFLREDIREERRTLGQRRGHKELMLTLKHAELLGYRHLFDW